MILVSIKRKLKAIPRGWEVKKIEEVSKQVFAGGTPSTRKPDYWDGDIPWMSSGEINNRFIYYTDKMITKVGYESSSTKMVPKNSILIALAGQGKTRGTVGMNKIELCTNQSIASIVPEHMVDPKYLYYNLDSRYDELRRLSTGDGGRGGLNLKIINNIHLALPPLKEQRKISKILSTWDKAIELKEKLIEQKKEQKKGLMQKLLTGEVRVPGFNGKWKEYRLGTLSEISTGNKDTKDKVENGSYPFFVRSENIERINSYSYDGEAILIPGDGNIGQIYHYINGKFDFHQRVYKISDFNNKCIGKFIYYYLQQYFYREAMKYSAKATVDSLRLPMLTDMIIQLPEIPEQIAIVKILDAADKEISFFNLELEKLNLQKKGLMQLLLTGKVRVKV